MRLIAVFVLVGCPSLLLADDGPRRIEPTGGSSAAVVVASSLPLAHTAQVLPLDRDGKVIAPGQIAVQTAATLDSLDAVLRAAQSSLDQAVKVNVVVARTEDVVEVSKVFEKRLAKARPALSFVVGQLSHREALVALDAVAVAGLKPAGGEVARIPVESLPGVRGGTHVAVLPPGPRVYIAGQAERGKGLAEATRKTLESLRATLKFLDLKDEQVVQLKTFVKPMSAVPDVEREIVAFYGGRKAPPVVHVEWSSDQSIEIELIAAAPEGKRAATVDYLTPPFMKASPVYSRVARLNSGRVVYVGGLYSGAEADAVAEVKSIFTDLERLVQAGGSDLKHLVKATYYVSTDAASQQLNELRLKYYDPQRPPAASKAVVAGVGRPGRSLTIDMIAVTPEK